MKVVETIQINYVVPESEEERLALEALIAEVRAEKFNRDYFPEDFSIVEPQNPPAKGGRWIPEK
jgi:hypothetical protein